MKPLQDRDTSVWARHAETVAVEASFEQHLVANEVALAWEADAVAPDALPFGGSRIECWERLLSVRLPKVQEGCRGDPLVLKLVQPGRSRWVRTVECAWRSAELVGDWTETGQVLQPARVDVLRGGLVGRRGWCCWPSGSWWFRWRQAHGGLGPRAFRLRCQPDADVVVALFQVGRKTGGTGRIDGNSCSVAGRSSQCHTVVVVLLEVWGIRLWAQSGLYGEVTEETVECQVLTEERVVEDLVESHRSVVDVRGVQGGWLSVVCVRSGPEMLSDGTFWIVWA